jgi:hypothetical protein
MIYWGCQWGYHPDFSNGTICEFHGILKWDDVNGISIDSRLMPSGNLTQEWGDLNQQRLGFNKQRLGFRKEMADLTNTNQKFHKQTWTLNTQKRLIFTNKHGKFVNKHRGVPTECTNKIGRPPMKLVIRHEVTNNGRSSCKRALH